MLNLLNNLKLRNRILAGYSVPIALSVITAGTVVVFVGNAKYQEDQLVEASKITLKTRELQTALLKKQSSSRGYMLQKTDDTRSAYKEAKEKVREALEFLKANVKDSNQQEKLRKLADLAVRLSTFNDNLIALGDQGRSAEAVAIWRQGLGRQLTIDIESVVNDFVKVEEQILLDRKAGLEAALNLLNVIVWVGAILSAVLAFVLGNLIASTIAQAVKESISKIATSSTEIAATVEQQERTVAQQASSVNETTTTMEELGASSLQAAEQAEASASGARQVLTLVDEGTRASEQAMEGMSNLREKVSAIAEQIMRLGEQTGQIAGISDLVSDIANQTNMLALNAAVEAVRAGEQGKGFGVVAAEIRKLADQTKKSAEKINALVAEVQASMNSTVMVTDEGTKTALEGIRLAEGTAKTFTSVADAINNVFVNSQQITLSSKQQAVAVQQVVAAMNSINIGAQETASAITQVKSSMGLLNETAQNLKALV